MSAFISSKGAPARLVELVAGGNVTLLMSPKVVDELMTVLYRPKFRRYGSEGDADAYIGSLWDLADHLEDPTAEALPPICRDPRDDYLIYLAEDASATMLITGDDDLLCLQRGMLDITKPANALASLTYEHPWGRGYVPATMDQVQRQVEAEGHGAVLAAASLFIRATGAGSRRLLRSAVTPESYRTWWAERGNIASDLAARGMGTKPEYPSPNVAYVKLPPDPGELIRSVGQQVMPDALVLTLLRQTKGFSRAANDGWRVHAVSSFLPDVDELPARPV